MKILISHLGTQCECFIATSLLKGLRTEYKFSEIHCLTKPETRPIFKHNKNVASVKTLEDNFSEEFDLFINLHPDPLPQISAKKRLGFGADIDAARFQDVLYGNKRTSMSMFQLYYRLAGLRWRGQGFDFYYYPRNRQDNRKTGLAIADINLRNYVTEKLKLDKSRLWVVPFRTNILRKIDEVNKCACLVTDDFFSMNIGLYLRKDIFFLKTKPCNVRLEFFGRGQVYTVPPHISQYGD